MVCLTFLSEFVHFLKKCVGIFGRKWVYFDDFSLIDFSNHICFEKFVCTSNF